MPLNFAPISDGFSSKASSLFLCHSCRSHKVLLSVQRRVKAQVYSRGRGLSPWVRHNSTIASISAINAKKDIPTQLQGLHSTLSALQNEAIFYVNLSQLRLALRGLESRRLVTRIAVLGIRDQQGARRLVRALLADPLKPESEWEKQLLEAGDGDGRGLLLRYSENLDFDKRHPLFKTLSIPSSTLHAHNLEIFIQTLPLDMGPSNEGRYGFLLPSMDIPINNRGRASTMIYPVHKAIIYAGSLQDISNFVRNLHPAIPGDIAERHMIKGIIDGPWEPLSKDPDLEPLLNSINLGQAEDAIHAFRNSSDMAMKYEHSWFVSGLADISKWAVTGTNAEPSPLQPSLQRLIEVITKNALQILSQEEQSLALQRQASKSKAASMRSILSQRLATWAEFAHSDLRDQLGLAFIGRNWKKLAWWKLFWRIDDVNFITSDILQRYWLVQAEKTMIWLSGQIEQAGQLETLKSSNSAIAIGDAEANLRTASMGGVETSGYAFGSFPPPPRVSDIVAETYLKGISKSVLNENFAYPWPQDISRARLFLSTTTIPPLQALCQRLLFQTITTTVITSSLSSLLYIYVSTTSVYEAGAIAAVGFVYSLQRLQKKWNFAKGVWEASVREEGRRILRRVEDKMRRMLVEEPKGNLDAFEDKDRLVARKAVEQVQEELNKLNGNGKADDVKNIGA